MTTALEIMQAVFRRANMQSELTSFSTSQNFPFNMALDCLNRAIDDLNEVGRYRFMVTSTPLTYSAGVYTYSMFDLSIEPESITEVERSLSGNAGKLMALNSSIFRSMYRRSEVPTAMPTAWTDYGDVLELNAKPDQNYSLLVWHMPSIGRKAATTDEIEIPQRYQYVLRDMAYAWLLETLGRGDFDKMYGLARQAAKKLVSNDHTLRSRPLQMPRSW